MKKIDSLDQGFVFITINSLNILIEHGQIKCIWGIIRHLLFYVSLNLRSQHPGDTVTKGPVVLF